MLPININETHPTDCFRVYAIAARASIENALSSNQVSGLGSLGLAYVQVCDLVAVTSSHPQKTIECDLSADNLTAFSDNLTELHQAFDILPFRFTRAVTIGDIQSLLREHHDAYQENLRRIADCTELNARWASDALSAPLDSSDNDSAEIGHASGGNYLRAKQRAAALERVSESELRGIALAIGSRAGISCVDTRSSLRRIRSAEQSSTLVFGLEVLIRRREAEEYLQTLSEARFRDCLPTIATGPWPPFSFVKDVNSAMVRAPFCASATEEPVQNRAIFFGTEAAS